MGLCDLTPNLMDLGEEVGLHNVLKNETTFITLDLHQTEGIVTSECLLPHDPLTVS